MALDQAAFLAHVAASELRLSPWAWLGSATTTPPTSATREGADASLSRARNLSGQRSRHRPRRPLAARFTLQPA